MQKNKSQQLKEYVELVARKHGGLEGLREMIRAQASSNHDALESFAPAGAASPYAAAAVSALESMDLHRPPTPPDEMALEAIINEDLRPVIDVVNGKFTSTHFLWTKLNDDVDIRTRLENSMRSIGRIELPGHPRRIPYGGTGFVVGKGLLMTNRHVAELFASGLGTRSVKFKTGHRAEIDFIREHERPVGRLYPVTRVVMIHPYWDMAILEVDGLEEDRGLTLSTEDARDLTGREIAVIGYPGFDPRNPRDVQQNLFNGRYGIKRLQPGELQGGYETASFQKMVKAATHDCSTLGGNSGSALIDLSTGHVLALHFGGEYHARNYAVPAYELARDPRVVDARVQFTTVPQTDPTAWKEWWDRAEATPPESAAADPNPKTQSVSVSTPSVTTHISDNGRLDAEITINIRLSLGGGPSDKVGKTAGAANQTAEAQVEALVEPEHDTDYSTRTGYDSQFLAAGLDVPMPTAQDPSILAPTRSGTDVLHYQNFSLRMHAARRLALLTACNVTTEPALREPEPGRDYSRRGLSGLRENDREKWFKDSRLDDKFQIPDVFFTKDRGAFDKGHICRRDDVAWGSTYEILKRANGDSYHVTNCSPQVEGFNQANKGVDNWGDLENHVLSQAGSERLCVFAGPVLASDDQVFRGVGEGRVQLLAKIPARYWKVIVARVDSGIAAYGFVLEQDLSDLPTEFVVAEEFVATMRTIEEIASLTGLAFDPSIIEADQFDTARGIEVALRADAVARSSGPRNRRSKDGTAVR